MNIEITIPELLIENWYWILAVIYSVFSWNITNVLVKKKIKHYKKLLQNECENRSWNKDILDCWDMCNPNPVVMMAPVFLPAYVLFRIVFATCNTASKVVMYPTRNVK